MTRHLYILSLLLFLTGCVKYTPSEDQLVVEGWIENGESPVVFVSSSITNTFTEQDMQDIMSHLAYDARVTVSYQDRTYQLMPILTDKYIMGMYYSNSALKGKVGGTYRLDVQWRDMHATGTTTILEPGQLDSIVVERDEYSDSLYAIKVHVVPTPGRHSYYRFFSQDVGRDSTYAASMSNLYDSELVREDEMFYIYRGISNPLEEFDNLFHQGDMARFKIASIDEDMYSFWNIYNESQIFSSVAILPYYNKLKGNLDGALGYWAGYGKTEYSVKIE